MYLENDEDMKLYRYRLLFGESIQPGTVNKIDKYEYSYEIRKYPITDSKRIISIFERFQGKL